MGTIIQNLADELNKIDEDFENNKISNATLRKKLKQVARRLNSIASSR